VTGAAIQAAILTGAPGLDNMLLSDATSITLGIETEGGVMTPILECNSTVPCKRTQIFSMNMDNERSIRVQVYEGEQSITRLNNLLGVLELSGFPPDLQGAIQVKVTFDLDANCALSVCAEEQTTMKKGSINIVKERLTKDEIARMVLQEENFKKQDKEARELEEALENPPFKDHLNSENLLKVLKSSVLLLLRTDASFRDEVRALIQNQ